MAGAYIFATYGTNNLETNLCQLCSTRICLHVIMDALRYNAERPIL